MNTTATSFVRVQRHPFRDPTKRWLVYCDECDHATSNLFGLAFNPLGWAGKWEAAQDYAARHAARHVAAACQTCGHMRPLPEDCRAVRPDTEEHHHDT